MDGGSGGRVGGRDVCEVGGVAGMSVVEDPGDWVAGVPGVEPEKIFFVINAWKNCYI